jgi:hypothetical protein
MRWEYGHCKIYVCALGLSSVLAITYSSVPQHITKLQSHIRLETKTKVLLRRGTQHRSYVISTPDPNSVGANFDPQPGIQLS